MAEPFYGNPWDSGQFGLYPPIPGFSELDTPPFEGDPTAEGARIAAAIRMMQSIQRPGVFRTGAPPIPQIGTVANMLQTGGTPQAPPPPVASEQVDGASPWPIGPDGVPLSQTPIAVDGVPMPPARPWPISETGEETSSQSKVLDPKPRPLRSDPWTPQTPAVAPRGPTAPLSPSPSGSFMSDPRARAALLSFGLHMLQPPSYGDNIGSKLGRAVGAAGETLGNIETADLRQEEAGSKQELRVSQAASAEARAAAAAAHAAASGTRANAASERLQMMRLNEEGRLERDRLGAQIRISTLYQTYVKDVHKRNENAALMRTPLEPVLPIGTWMRANPMLRDLGLMPDSPDVDLDAPSSNLTGPGKTITGVSVQNVPTPTAPKVGDVRKGYKFKGGDPSKQESWEKVGQ